MTTPSPWDTTGPSAIAQAFYAPGQHRRARGVAPNLAPRERVAKVAKRTTPKLPPMDLDAVRQYIAQGHTVREAAIVFHRGEKTIREAIGSVLKYRQGLPKHKPRPFLMTKVRFEREAWEWILSQGGAPFLRALVDKARAQA